MKRIIDILASGLVDSDGEVLANGIVTAYEKNSTTLKTLYRDWDLTLPHPNPATLDDSGKLIAYADGRIKLSVADSDGVFDYSIDHIGNDDEDVAAAASEIVAGSGLSSVSGELEVVVDDVTVELSDGELALKAGGVSTDKIADGAVTTAKLAALNYTLSNSSSTFSNSGAAYVDVTNLSASITTTGKPVWIILVADGSSSESGITTGGSSAVNVRFLRGASVIAQQTCLDSAIYLPPSAFRHFDPVAAGTYTYKIQIHPNSQSVEVNRCKLLVYEMR
jgi:hypothetical protein